MVATLSEVKRSCEKPCMSGTKIKSTTFCWRGTSNGASTHLRDPIMEASGKVMGALAKEQLLDDQGLLTLLCEVEAIVNGRPITKVSDDPRDSEAPTPNHLLLLRAGPSHPPGHFQKTDNYSRRIRRQVQYLADVFWKRWMREYLP